MAANCSKYWCRLRDSNPRPSDYKSDAIGRIIVILQSSNTLGECEPRPNTSNTMHFCPQTGTFA